MDIPNLSIGYKPLFNALNTISEDISGIQIAKSLDRNILIYLHIRTKEAYRKWVCDKDSILYHTKNLRISKRNIDTRFLLLKYQLL